MITSRICDCYPGGKDNFAAEQTAEATRHLNQALPQQARLRDRAGVALFTGPGLVLPGLVRVTEWRPESELQGQGITAGLRRRGR